MWRPSKRVRDTVNSVVSTSARPWASNRAQSWASMEGEVARVLAIALISERSRSRRSRRWSPVSCPIVCRRARSAATYQSVVMTVSTMRGSAMARAKTIMVATAECCLRSLPPITARHPADGRPDGRPASPHLNAESFRLRSGRPVACVAEGPVQPPLGTGPRSSSAPRAFAAISTRTLRRLPMSVTGAG